ncbi:uncharacterized protein [Aegilops tauschii subsp. strangulata]|uniref:uncharacterized protein n=1 Tax=Aegilops tauschii subsp. strangulata TaxID=200361 RepID=UPI003CC8BAED
MERAASAIEGGSDQGGVDETPTHPKPSGAGRLVAVRQMPEQVGPRDDVAEDGNWDGPTSEGGLLEDVENQIDGEVDMDDVAFVSVDFKDEEEEDNESERETWKLMSLYRSQRRPSAKTLSKHFDKIWQLRTGVEFQPIRNNFYTITLFSEGDFRFVARGGPWIYDGDALLVASFDNEARPSENQLDAVSVWVRVFDIPWKKRTRAYGNAVGGALGEVLEVDAPESGYDTNEFLRIRIKLPYNRRLQKEITLEYKTKGVIKRSTFKLKYERVPHFCFHCGFMGHDKDACEKRIGMATKGYDSTLRCSPFKKFEQRPAYTPSLGQPRARRAMDFSLGSAGTATQYSARSESSRSHQQPQPKIPTRVDAHDGFEETEGVGEVEADEQLAKHVEGLKLRLQKEKPKCSKVQQMRKQFEAKSSDRTKITPKQHRKKPAGGQKKVPANKKSGMVVRREKELDRDDMIPALHDLDNLEVSFGSVRESMDFNDSALGKRQMESLRGRHLIAHDGNAVVPFEDISEGGVQKRGKLGARTLRMTLATWSVRRIGRQPALGPLTKRGTSDIPWLVAKDFNEAMWDFEHLSSTPRPRNQMVAFRECLEDCQLADLGFSGHPFTYDNKRGGRANVQVRLDRAVADNQWHDLFPECKVSHLTSPCSNHCPIILRCVRETRVRTGRTRRYEVMWEREPALSEIVEEAWKAAGANGHRGNISAALRWTLLARSSKKVGNITKEIEKSRTRLEELTNMNADRNEIRRESDHMNELLYKEEMMWLQRSRVEWLKHGDRNTKFFHRKAVWRARKNKIKGLIDTEGNYQTDHHVMSVPLFEEMITAEMNTKLCGQFSEKEISDALFQIGPLKAPGPDGLPARFFQRHWSILKDEIIAEVSEFFATGIMPEGVNSTTIVLIPKVDNPKMMTEFRPISLCNVVYKIISKCLVNRLRPILGDVVSEEQSAFVPGRLITDNALIAFKCTHYIRQEKDPDRSFCAYKLDLSKAYDRVDWRFLEQVMQRMGFASQWVKWIMACVISVRKYKTRRSRL